LYDDAEGNPVVIEMVIKILFITATLHKQQGEKCTFKYFRLKNNALKD